MCEHKNKAYSTMNQALLCNPPIMVINWICKDCGCRGQERNQTSLNNDYEETVKKWPMP